MFKRLNELNFVIGLFFFLISLILLVGALVSPLLSGKINIYTGLGFLLFGILMMAVRSKGSKDAT